MKKVILMTAVAVLSTGFVVLAQDAKPVPQKREIRQADPAKIAEMRVKRLQSDVGSELSDAQQKQAYEIFLKTEQKRPEYRTEAREKMEQVRAEEDAAIAKILNPEQSKKFTEMQQQREEHQKQAIKQRMERREQLKAAPGAKPTPAQK